MTRHHLILKSYTGNQHSCISTYSRDIREIVSLFPYSIRAFPRNYFSKAPFSVAESTVENAFRQFTANLIYPDVASVIPAPFTVLSLCHCLDNQPAYRRDGNFLYRVGILVVRKRANMRMKFNSQLESAPKCAKSIQYVVLKNIQPWMSWRAASVRGSLSHKSPASNPSAIVCNQFKRDNIRGRASWKFLSVNTWNIAEQTLPV